MSKLAILATLIIPFVAKRRSGTVAIVARDDAATEETVVTDAAADLASVPAPPVQPKTVAKVDAPLAVSLFLEQMREFAGGQSMSWKILHDRYWANMQREFDWPDLSEKVLSQMLVERGCRRFQVDLRSKGQGRPTYFYFQPVADARGHWETQVQEEMELAA